LFENDRGRDASGGSHVEGVREVTGGYDRTRELPPNFELPGKGEEKVSSQSGKVFLPRGI